MYFENCPSFIGYFVFIYIDFVLAILEIMYK